MSIIEQAAKRLEELRRAGVAVEGGETQQAADSPEVAGMPQADLPAANAGAGMRRREPHIGVTEQTIPPTAADDQLSRDGSRRVTLDLAHIANGGIVTPDAPRSQVADEFRVVKRPLIGNAKGKGAVPIKNGNLIMVTSAVPGEGKSFTSINLAMSIAMELDNTVLLVDADVARPSVLDILGLPPAKGLLDVLTNETIELGQVLLKTNIEKLSILPSGTPHQRATELLASGAMTSLLDEMATRYADRIIIFDSPPLVVTTEARVLASHMGQVVVVVEAEKTTHATVRQALATIEACPVKLMVLNKARSQPAGAYYGYYRYGGYGYGA